MDKMQCVCCLVQHCSTMMIMAYLMLGVRAVIICLNNYTFISINDVLENACVEMILHFFYLLHTD